MSRSSHRCLLYSDSLLTLVGRGRQCADDKSLYHVERLLYEQVSGASQRMLGMCLYDSWRALRDHEYSHEGVKLAGDLL
jgi:hypothetical protein